MAFWFRTARKRTQLMTCRNSCHSAVHDYKLNDQHIANSKRCVYRKREKYIENLLLTMKFIYMSELENNTREICFCFYEAFSMKRLLLITVLTPTKHFRFKPINSWGKMKRIRCLFWDEMDRVKKALTAQNVTRHNLVVGDSSIKKAQTTASLNSHFCNEQSR